MKKVVVFLLILAIVSLSGCAIMKADEIVGLDLGKNGLKITKQPSNITVVAGAQANFAVKARGNGELTYQWYYKTPESTDWKAVSNNGDKTEYSLTTKFRHNGNQYYCQVADGNGNTANSKIVTLTVKSTVSITTQPANITVAVGQEAKFIVTAKGVGELTYQWYYKQPGEESAKEVKINGKDAIYLLTAEERHNGNQYYCVVTDETGSTATSNTVSLTVTA